MRGLRSEVAPERDAFSLNGCLGTTYFVLGIGSSTALLGLDLRVCFLNIDPRILYPSGVILEIA